MATRKKKRRAYVAPHVVDFGAIEVMTGDCLGFCTDGFHGGFWGLWPPP